MNKESDNEFTSAFDAPAEIAPFLTDLVEDMWALGSSPDVVVEILEPLRLPPDETHVLDLGCGKGAVCVTLARDLGFRATGIDICKPFLEVAEKKAAEYGVAGLCKFEQDDLKSFLGQAAGYDIAILISLGAILGGFDETVGSMRKAVGKGGYIIIDDGFLNSAASLDRRHYRHYAPHKRTLELLTSHGDTIVTERIYSNREMRAINDFYIASISSKAAEIVKGNPGLEQPLARYIQGQKEECEVIDRCITGAMWLIRKG
jgi:predicted TPR repeat methyltransferase